MPVDFDYINGQLASMVERIAPEWFPNGKYISGNWLVGNVDGDPGKSLSIDIANKPGRWHDYATDEGGDLVDLYSRLHKLNQIDSAVQLCARYGIGSELPQTRSIKKWKKPDFKLVPPPIGAPAPAQDADMKWIYRDLSGATLFYIARYNEEETGEDGKVKKRFLPWCWDELKARWVSKQWPEPRPLYNLHEIYSNPEKPIVIVEGEKAADSLRAIASGRYVTVTWPGGASGYSKADWTPIRNRNITVWPDADDAGRKAGENIAALLHSQGCKVKIIDTEGCPPKWDAADALKEGWDLDKVGEWARAHARTYTDITHPPAPASMSVQLENPQADTIKVTSSYQQIWSALGLYVNGNGNPIANEANVLQVMRAMGSQMPDVWKDTFHRKVMARECGRAVAMNEEHAQHLLNIIQERLGIHNMTEEKVWKGMTKMACTRTTNEASDWVKSLTWDGVNRCEEFFNQCTSTPRGEYQDQVSRNFWISLTARMTRPGCQVDNMVILEGLQGAGKTSLFRVLGGTWYAEVCQKTFDPREFAMILPGKIIVEMGELHAFRTADIEQMKQFISTCTDSYRAPYDKGSKDWPRQNIFIGTTNHDTYLTDPTGGRRFWPIATGAIHLDYARQWRDQLFAEGYARLERGEPWHIVPDEAKEQQEVRRIMDPWEERLAAVGSKLYNGITTLEIMDNVLQIDMDRQDSRMTRRIGASMRLLGWKQYAQKVGGSFKRVWEKQESQLKLVDKF